MQVNEYIFDLCLQKTIHFTYANLRVLMIHIKTKRDELSHAVILEEVA